MGAESITSKSNKQQKFEYYLRQLELAHKRNELVDKLRVTLLQIFFSFQAIVIGATVLKGSDVAAIRQQLGGLSILFPILVLMIGYSMFVAFFRWHITLYKYKTWIESIEKMLKSLVFGSSPNIKHTGTLYLDYNEPEIAKVLREGTAGFILVAMGVLNLGIVFLLLRLFGASSLEQTSVISLSVIGYLGTVVLMSIHMKIMQNRRKKELGIA